MGYRGAVMNGQVSGGGAEPTIDPKLYRLKQGTFTTQRSLELLLALDDEGFVEILLALVAHPEHGQAMLYEERIGQRLSTIRHEHPPLYLGVLLPGLRQRDNHLPQRIEQHLNHLAPRRTAVLAPPETLTDLLAADIPTPIQLFEGLMHEGMLLFGGKSKRGKSWLIFDLAIALAVGRAGFRHFPCPEPRPVLYLALEDGRARLQKRARSIQPNLMTVDQFHLRYSFPMLAEGGVELLAEEIARYQYGLVIIDVLAKLEQGGSNGAKNYHEVYDMFTPLQELRKQHPFCLAMLTHLRKQEAEDMFDTLLGSVAYQGAQDVLWVLERKPKDDFAFLHIRDKDAEETTIALRFIEGHWEYVGEGEEYEISRDQRKVIRILSEENRELGIEEIRRSAGFPENKYGYVRKLLVTMVKDDLIHHSRHGKYSATIRGTQEMAPEFDQDVPF